MTPRVEGSGIYCKGVVGGCLKFPHLGVLTTKDPKLPNPETLRTLTENAQTVSGRPFLARTHGKTAKLWLAADMMPCGVAGDFGGSLGF